MIDVDCPKCGGVGRVANNMVNTRLVCRKCHAIFHVSTTGRMALGEPPQTDEEKKGRKRDRDRDRGADAGREAKTTERWQESMPEFSVTGRSAAVALGVVAVVGIVYAVWSLPSESLTDKAKKVAEAIAAGDLGTLKALSASDTQDQAVEWYGIIHPQLDGLKKQWAGKDVLTGVLVIDENPRMKSGQVAALLAPSKPTERETSIATNALPIAVTQDPFEMTLYFTSDQWGKWWFDGKKTYDAMPKSR